MCAKEIVLALTLATGLVQRGELNLEQLLGSPDQYGRYATENQRGKIDPRPDAITQDYIEFASTHALKEGPHFYQQSWALEIGGGYGFVSAEVVKRGGLVIFNDAEPKHWGKAEQILHDVGFDTSFEILPGWFAVGPGDLADTSNLESFQPVKAILASMWLHFYTGREIAEKVLPKMWDIAKPGCEVFLKYGTPYNGLFKNYVRGYEARKRAFLRNPSLDNLPGEMADAHRYLPAAHYQSFFHAIDNDVMVYLASHDPGRRWEVVQEYRIRRPDPPEQSYKHGYAKGRTEIMGLRLRKPVTVPR